jgi:hypothetical protein
MAFFAVSEAYSLPVYIWHSSKKQNALDKTSKINISIA